MKQSILSIVMLSALALTVGSCTTTKSEDVANAKTEQKEAKDKLDKANAAYEEEVSEYRKEIEGKIQDNEAMIAQMKAEKASSVKEVQLDREARINELEKRNNELDQKIKTYKGEDQKNWKNFKAELKHDMQELGKSFQDFGSNDVADKK